MKIPILKKFPPGDFYTLQSESTVLEHSVKNTVERQNFGMRKSYKLGFLGAEPDVFNTRSGTGSIFQYWAYGRQKSRGSWRVRGQGRHIDVPAGAIDSQEEAFHWLLVTEFWFYSLHISNRT